MYERLLIKIIFGRNIENHYKAVIVTLYKEKYPDKTFYDINEKKLQIRKE